MNQAKKKPFNSKLARVIAVNLFLIVFCLAGAFGGTIAWFNSSISQEATVSTFQVVAPPGLNFELYYIDHFEVNDVDKDGNQNVTTKLFSGYQLEYTTPVFAKVEYDENGHSSPLYYSAAGNLVTLKDNVEACTQVNDGYLYTDGLQAQPELSEKLASSSVVMMA